jgi:RNA polymerase primary sigma factor
MSVAELRELEEVKGLIARGQQVGVLTYPEIATATAELGLEESDVEELHGVVEGCEIELVEEIDPAIAAGLEIQRSRAPEQRSRRTAALDLRPEGTTDALGLFLKEIGKVSGAAISTPSRRWSSPTCAWSSRSRRTTATRACRSST